jgi:hypothetical protein
MIVKIIRGKPVNKVVEIETDNVIHSEVFGNGGRLSFDNGDMIALSGSEWKQWVEANAWPEEVVDVKPIKSKIQPEFVKVVRDKRGLYEKGKIR